MWQLIGGMLCHVATDWWDVNLIKGLASTRVSSDNGYTVCDQIASRQWLSLARLDDCLASIAGLSWRK